MDKADLDAIGGFNSVWSRVSGAAEPLTTLADSAERQRELLCALARCYPAISGKLTAMARAEAALICALRAEQFLATGEDHRPAPACAVIRGKLCSLRDAYVNSGKLAAALTAAANAASDDTRCALDRLAADERCRERALRELILRELGANCS